MERRYLYILIGPPGSGKGTQADFLSKDFKAIIISAGQLLRAEVDKKTADGRRARPYILKGLLAPDSLVADLVNNKLSKSHSDIILDGFPRNLTQAKLFGRYVENHKGVVNIVIELTVPVKKILERIAGRRHCSCGELYHLKYNPPQKRGICDKCGKRLKQRTDSKPDVIRTRLRIYRGQTKPIIQFFKDSRNYDYLKINSGKSIEAVHKELKNKIQKFHDQD